MKKNKLRPANYQDIENTNNRVFYFMEGEAVQRIQRRIPEDYPNYGLISNKTPGGKKMLENFIESCRWDWKVTTKKMKEFLTKQNLYIQDENN